MRQRRRIIAIVALLPTIVVIGIASALALEWNQDTERAANVGRRLADADDSTVLTVSGYAVSHREYAHELGQAEYTLDTMKETISEGSTSGDLPAGQETFLQEWVEIIERVGVENVAAGSIIAQSAMYQWAVSEGYSASEDEVAEAVEEQRQLQQELAGTRAEGMQQAFIAEVGEERYWNEILPRIMEREVVLSKAKLSIITAEQEATASDDGEWLDLQVDLVNTAEIEIIDPEVIDPETVERGREYIVEEYAELQRQRQDQRLP